MPLATTIRGRLAYRTEASFAENSSGVTTALQALRITGEGFEAVKTTVESDEIQDGGNLVDLLQTGQMVRGFFEFEFCGQHFDPFFAAAFRRLSFTETTAAKTGITGAASTDIFTSPSAHNLVVGDRVVLSALTGGSGLTDGGVYFVISTPTSTTFTLSTTLGGSSVNFTTNLTDGTITVTNYIRNGTATPSFFFERYYADIGKYHYFEGCMVEGLTLSIAANQKITGRVSLMGIKAGSGTTSRGTSTTAAPTTPAIITAGPRVASLLIDGASSSRALQKLDLEIRSNLIATPVVDSIYGQQPILGDWRLSVKPQFYFEDDVFTAKHLAHTTLALGFTIGTTSGAANASYAWSIPRLQFAKQLPALTKKNEHVMDPLDLVATLDASITAMASVTRTLGS